MAAEQATTTSECSSPATTESDDKEFEPSAEMMVNEYDDERTLDEEEGLSGESCCNELDDLQKEGDMPLEDLLAMYGYAGEKQEPHSSSEEDILSNRDLTLDKEEIARDLLKNEDGDKETTVNDLLYSMEVPGSQGSHTVRLLRSHSQVESSGDESDDEDYEPERDDDWKKTIQVGSDFQAGVPLGLCKYGDAPAYENEDRLLWDPNKLHDENVETYLHKVHVEHLQNLQGVAAIPTGSHVRDDEQALYLLLQCGHNIEEALRRQRMQSVPPTDPMSLWSEEECRNFENGLRVYGKDFHLIQQHKVRTRSVGELVQFYYLWKKTERHDAFANKYRLEKKKYILHPGITDYMDRFVDELENPLPPQRDRSSSPNIHSLLYGDHKRQHMHLEGDRSILSNDNAIATEQHTDLDLNKDSATPLSTILISTVLSDVNSKVRSDVKLSDTKTDKLKSSAILNHLSNNIESNTILEKQVVSQMGSKVLNSTSEIPYQRPIDSIEPSPKRMRLLAPGEKDLVSDTVSSDISVMKNSPKEIQVDSTDSCSKTVTELHSISETLNNGDTCGISSHLSSAKSLSTSLSGNIQIAASSDLTAKCTLLPAETAAQ